jgi:CO/xanthine dehydrogenase FAD-binding subunit
MDLPGVTEIADPRTTAWLPGDAWLAGGTWLFSEPQPGVSRLLDLTAFGWPSLRADATGLEIAATCTLAELAALPRRWPAAALAPQCCAALLGSFKVQHMATVGGNLCLALPAGPMISLAAALDGTCLIWGAGCTGTSAGPARRMAVADFVTGAGSCALAPGEVLRSVHLPAPALAAVTAFRRISLSPGGRSAALVIGRRDPGGGVVVTVTAATVRPVQLRFPRLPSGGDLLAALGAARPRWHDDVHGAPAWRAAMTRRLALEVRAELAAS